MTREVNVFAFPLEKMLFATGTLNDMADAYHQMCQHFWRDPVTHEPHDKDDVQRVLAPKILLMHSELSEMTEAVRKNMVDDHIPARKGEEVELADLILRALDYAGARRLDLAGAMRDKLHYNMMRQDHTDAARAQPNGKKF